MSRQENLHSGDCSGNCPGDVVASLKRRIAHIEGREVHFRASPAVSEGWPDGFSGASAKVPAKAPERLSGALPRWHLGLGAVDRMLPNGALVHAGLHEVVAASHGDGPAAGGFAVALMTRLLLSLKRSNRSLVLWCARGLETREFGRLYGPGLMAMGLDPAHLVVAAAERKEDLLWAMEEGVKTPALAGVVGEVGAAGLVAMRRLQLAARASGVPAVVLRSARDARPSVARTQWRVSALPPVFAGDDAQAFPARFRWRVTLERCRGPVTGAWPRSWDLEWDHETHCFHMAAPLAGRSAAQAPGDAGRPGHLRQTG